MGAMGREGYEAFAPLTHDVDDATPALVPEAKKRVNKPGAGRPAQGRFRVVLPVVGTLTLEVAADTEAEALAKGWDTYHNKRIPKPEWDAVERVMPLPKGVPAVAIATPLRPPPERLPISPSPSPARHSARRAFGVRSPDRVAPGAWRRSARVGVATGATEAT